MEDKEHQCFSWGLDLLRRPVGPAIKLGFQGPTRHKEVQEKVSRGHGSQPWLRIDNTWGALRTTKASALAPEIFI